MAPAILQIYRNEVVPRLFFPAFWTFCVLTLPIFFVGVLLRKPSRSTMLAIQAGERGWDSIFFQEVIGSAREYLNDHRVFPMVVDRNKSYIRQLVSSTRDTRPTHFFFDPRTTSHSTPRAFFQAASTGIYLLAKGVIPIVFLTDASCRNWRMQSSLITSWSGVIVTCMSNSEIGNLIPHRRVLGPVLMPLSASTFNQVSRLKLDRTKMTEPVIRFVGLGYSPRIEWLIELQRVLCEEGVRLELHTQKLETSNIDYWRLLVDSDIVVTTTMQMEAPGYDHIWKPQVVFRFTEALAAGTALVAPDVPGVNRYLQAGVHFLAYDSLDDCKQSVLRLVANKHLRERVADDGNLKMKYLVGSQVFWLQVDSCLGRNSML